MRYQKVDYGMPPSLKYYHSNLNAPYIALLKIRNDLEQQQYFLIYVMRKSIVAIVSEPRLCPHVSSMFRESESRTKGKRVRSKVDLNGLLFFTSFISQKQNPIENSTKS
jgi:hypothetical protein